MADTPQNNCSKLKFVFSEAGESEILVASITLCSRQEDLASVMKFYRGVQWKFYFISQQTLEIDYLFFFFRWYNDQLLKPITCI